MVKFCVGGNTMSDIETGLKEKYKEFWYDIYNIEKKEVRNLKAYIDYVEKTLRNYMSSDIDYSGIKNLFIQKQLDYLDEAFSSMLLGNYNALSCMIRIMIENYVSLELIKKYRKEQVWKDWYLHGHYKLYKSMDREPYYTKLKDCYNSLCDILNVSHDYINDRNSYGWLRRVVKLKSYNFKNACVLVNPRIYKDYENLSSQIHNNTFPTKRSIFLMEQLAHFIHQIYFYTDKTIAAFDRRYFRRPQYNVLARQLLESIYSCLNYGKTVKE